MNKSGTSFLGSISLCLLFMEVKKWEHSMFLIVFIFEKNKREKWLYSETLVAGGAASMGGGVVESVQNCLENLENIPHFLNANKPNHKMDVWSSPTPNSYSFNLAALAEMLRFFGTHTRQFCWPWIPCRWLFWQAWRYRDRVDLFVGSPFPVALSWNVLEPFILCWVLSAKAVLLQCFHLQEAADYLGLGFFCFPGN